MAYVGFGIEGFSNDLKKFLYVERMFVTIKMVFHFQKKWGENCENTHIFLHSKENSFNSSLFSVKKYIFH